LEAGRDLEHVVARRVVRQRKHWTLTKADEYLRNPDLRIGATPDYYILDDDGRRGVLQIKTAFGHIIDRDWSEGNEPPLWVLLQTSTEAMLDDAAFAALAVMNRASGKLETTIFEF
jgi:hypothetical protein